MPGCLFAVGDPADLLVGVAAAHVWGYSWGTIIAENLAAAAPGRVQSLVLGGYPVGLDAAQRAAMEVPAEEFSGSRFRVCLRGSGRCGLTRISISLETSMNRSILPSIDDGRPDVD